MKTKQFCANNANKELFCFYNEESLNSFIDYIDYFPVSDNNHTMSKHINQYVSQKLPVENIKEALVLGFRIEIHGIYPLHFEKISNKLGYKIISHIEFCHIPHKKNYNFIRPKFFVSYNNMQETVLVIAVTPGTDYIYHYSAMVRHYLSNLSPYHKQLMRIYRYPYLEDNIDKLSMTENSSIYSADIIVIGYVEEIQKYLKSKLHDYTNHVHENDYYICNKYILDNNHAINFIGVKFSYWGNISKKIVQAFCKNGIKEVIYIGKLGTLGFPEEIYEKIFSPSSYVVMKYDKIEKTINSVKNDLLKYFPEFDSGLHLSVPTVMEEDSKQRKIAESLKANSIDNEISQIAAAIEEYNTDNNSSINFTSLHFATDYLKKTDDHDEMVNIGLYNNREKYLLIKKQVILKKISSILWKYLQKKYY